MALQFDRQLSCVALDESTGHGIELSNLRCVFRVQHALIDTPSELSLRIYNPADDTARFLFGLSPELGGAAPTGAAEAAAATTNPVGIVQMSAGYPGNFGVVFQGGIVQVRIGRESPTDTYVDITAADGDLAHNWAVINTSLAAGYTPADVQRALADAWSSMGAGCTALPEGTPLPAAPRGRVLFGNPRQFARQLARQNNWDWYIAQNKVEWLPRSAYKPGEAVLLNTATGLLGMPEQTAMGVVCRCLLNPAIGHGSLVQIDNKLVQQYRYDIGLDATNPVPSVAADGSYKVWYVDHVGDTRGQGDDWYTEAVCIALDSSIKPMTTSVPYSL